MTALTHSAPAVVPNVASKSRRRTGGWQKAMARFQASLEEMKIAGDIHTVADEAKFAARRALEEVTPPPSLTGTVNVEFYFNDGLRMPILNRYASEIALHNEKTITAYAKDDASRDHLLGELRTWRDQRQHLEAALAEASKTEAATNKAWCAALAKSDAQLLRVLRTPSSTLSELHWKIAMLRKADCGSYTEETGWAYVMSELAMLAE